MRVRTVVFQPNYGPPVNLIFFQIRLPLPPASPAYLIYIWVYRLGQRVSVSMARRAGLRADVNL